MEVSAPGVGATLLAQDGVVILRCDDRSRRDAHRPTLQREGQVVDFSDESTRITVDVLERTIFSDGFGRDPNEVRAAMSAYFDTVGRIDPFDILGLLSVVPRPTRGS